MSYFESVSPVSNEDPNALPVKELGRAIAYFESVLGFSVVSRGDSTVLLRRDEAQVGLTQ